MKHTGSEKVTQMLQRFLFYLTALARLLTIAHFSESDSTTVLEVSINLKDPRGKTSDYFLSVTLDAGLLSKHWKGFDFSNKGVQNMARSLSPAYLRIGGTAEDFLTFNPGSGSLNWREETEFTAYDWDTVNEFAKTVNWDVIFGLNVLTRKSGQPWNPSNALELIRYTADRGYRVSWELGNGRTFSLPRPLCRDPWGGLRLPPPHPLSSPHPMPNPSAGTPTKGICGKM